jgi:hypothetical protein
MAKVRNHVHYIRPVDGIAKGTEEIDQKAKAELKTPDPVESKKIVAENTVESIKVESPKKK